MSLLLLGLIDLCAEGNRPNRPRLAGTGYAQLTIVVISPAER